jgi:hypothetical protein
MISQAPKIRVKTNSPIGNDVFFALPDLSGNNSSFLEADVAAGITSLSANGTFFSAGQYIIIGQPGQEKSEIVKINNPSSTAITLLTALTFSHNRGDLITLIEYNQIEPQRSTDAGVSYTPLTIVDINPQVLETYLQRTGDATTDYYKFRFYNSTSTLYSGYSDPVIASGYDDNTVYAIKHRALSQLGENVNDLITDDFLNESLNEGRRIVDMGTATVDGVQQRVLRWSFRTKFNTDIGNIVPGAWSVTAPTDLRDRNTYKNILGLRIGRSNWPCVYQDQRRFRQNYLNVAHTTLNGAILTGDTSIVLTSSGDFDASGTIYIGAETVLLTNDAVAYTANNVSTNTISGVTGIVSGGHASGRDVWQEATFGMPTAYTIDNATIYFDVPFDDDYAGENIYLDYYQSLTAVNSDSDVLDEPFYDLYVPYLKFKIKSLKSNGALKPTDDGDYLLFQQGFSELVSQEVSGQNVNFTPDIWGSLNGGYGGRGWY